MINGDYVEVDKDAVFLIGERVRMTFDIWGFSNAYLLALQLKKIEDTIDADDRLELWSTQIVDTESGGKQVIIEAVVVAMDDIEYAQGGIGVAVIVLASIIAIGIFGAWGISKVEKLASTPAGQIATAGMGVSMIAIPLIVIAILLGLTKK